MIILLLLFFITSATAGEGLPTCRGFDTGACVRSQEMNELSDEPKVLEYDHYTPFEPLSEGEARGLREWQKQLNKGD